MLIELTVANFRSFREPVTLSLEVEPRLSERDKTVDERNVARTEEGDLLRVASIYGANASGKSNLLQALAVLRRLVLHSAREGQCGDPLPANPFHLDPVSAGEPSEIEVVYAGGGRQLRYGAAFTREKITREWLYARAAGSAQEERWFERTLDRYEAGGAWLRDPVLEARTRPGALHLSAAAAWRHPQAEVVLEWFKGLRIVHSLDDIEGLERTIALLDREAEGGAVRRLVRALDLGVDDLRVAAGLPPHLLAGLDPPLAARLADAPEGDGVLGRLARQRRVQTVRDGAVVELASESDGVARAIALAGPIVEALAGGGVLVVDDLDARLHTLLVRQLIELFQDPVVNRRDAQLIFTSHDTNLLTRRLLRRDQIWFVERSRKTRASDLYALAELRYDDGKRVRNDARYEEDYLQGRYGAIPHFGALQAILGEALATAE